jgi:hypothetical protein
MKKFVCAMYKTEHLKAAIAGCLSLHRDVRLHLSLMSASFTFTAPKGRGTEIFFTLFKDKEPNVIFFFQWLDSPLGD